MPVLLRFKAHPTHLWRGYAALVARNLPFTAMQFPMFEFLREKIQNRWPSPQQRQDQTIARRALITALSAGLAGGVAAIITTPIDVVKTSIMLAAADEGGGRGGGGKGKDRKPSSGKRGALDVGREIYRKEGMAGLFKGGALRASWTALGLSLYLSAYETGKMYFEQRRESKDRLDSESTCQ